MHELREPIKTAEQAMREEYQRIVYESGDTGIQLAKAVAIASENVQRMIDYGEVEAPDVLSALVTIGKSEDTRQKSSTDGALERLANGEVSIDMGGDPMLRMVVTLGKGDRKSWDYVTASDLRRIFELRRENLVTQKQAFERFEENYNATVAAVLAHRTVGEAVRAGAFGQEEARHG